MSKPIDADLLYISRLVAKVSTALFAGSAIYKNVVEYPAEMECGTKTAIALFEPCYRKSSMLTLVLASTGFLGAMSSYAIEPNTKWLAAGLLVFSAIPFNYLIMSSTTSSLLKPGVDKDSEKAELLLEKWNRMSIFKTLLGLSSMLIMEMYP